MTSRLTSEGSAFPGPAPLDSAGVGGVGSWQQLSSTAGCGRGQGSLLMVRKLPRGWATTGPGHPALRADAWGQG